MRKLLPILLGLSVPMAAMALNYSDSTSQYDDDSSFSKTEAAAISLLTNEGVVEGMPDGSFQSRRTLNRAEFMKIALLSREDIQVLASDADDCFPDVKRLAWYSRYVCLAKKRGVVGGNPDGLFHPERPVNYAEALKILGSLHYITHADPSGNAWYAKYAEGAQEAGVALPLSYSYSRFLTRGDMARLTAAYMAYSAGELDLYRASERGEAIQSSSSSRSSAASSVQSSSSTSSSSSRSSSISSGSSSSTAAALHGLPVRSRFLVLGERSLPIAGLKLFADKEAVWLRSVEIKFEDEVESIESMYFIDENGTEIGQVFLDKVFDSTEKTWRGTFAADKYRLAKGQEKVFAIEVRLKERNKGGASDELVQVESFRMTAQGEDSQSTYSTNSSTIVFPQHQTSQGRITSVVNALSSTTEALPLGNDQLIAAFTFAGTRVEGAQLRIRNLEFQLSKSGLTTTGFELGTSDSSTRHPCTVSGLIVSCSVIPDELGTITSGPRTLRLFADVALESGAQNAFLQVSLNQPGNVGENGAIHWNDGTGTFVWVELNSPIARSTKFQ